CLLRFLVGIAIGSEWSTPAIRRRISDFLAAGGVVFANADSLSLDISTGRRIDFPEKVFGVKFEHKYKNCFLPSTQSVAEAEWALPFDQYNSIYKLQGHLVHVPDDPRAWSRLYQRTPEKYLTGDDGKPLQDVSSRPVRHPDWKLIRDKNGKLVRDEEAWKQHDQELARMPREVLSIAQSPLDMRTPPRIRYALPAGSRSATPSEGPITTTADCWSEITVGRPTSGKPVAWWGDKVCGVETKNTVWLGTREGMSIHALAPRMSMHQTTEPCNPYPTEVAATYEDRRPYVEALGYAARKAGVTRPVTLLRGGKLPLNLEVLARRHENGAMMAVVINHDSTEATYQVVLDKGLLASLPQAEAWDMLREKTLEARTDGRFDLAIPAWGASVFMVAPPNFLQPIKKLQADLNRKDMSVPKYFADRPQLNTDEWNTPVPEK
ncbi:MAG: hypothetical protein HY290_00055, partial [Planctomycetia bacterium]|nr:hypothetical protein [Planctomycetia bacterium]